MSPTVQVLAKERTIYPIYNVLLNSHVFVATSFGHTLQLSIHIEDFNCGCSDKALIQILNSNDQVPNFSVELVSNANCKQNYKVTIPDCEKFGTYQIVLSYPFRIAEQIQQLKISALCTSEDEA